MINNIYDYKQSFVKRRYRLRDMSEDFKISAQTEQDDFKRQTKLWFAEQTSIMEGIFMELEIQVIINAGLKAQIEDLKDIVLQLPDVKNNEQMQNKINQLFKQYDSSR
jgi:hypothetical protein